MPNNQQLNQKQREAFEAILREKLHHAQRVLREKESEAEATGLVAVLKQVGASDMAANAKVLSEQLSEVESELGKLGFELDVRDGELKLQYRAPEELQESFNSLVRSQLVPEKQKVEEIERALMNSWSIATLPEAK